MDIVDINYDVHWIDVSPFLISGEQPIYLLPRLKLHNESKAWAGSTQIANTGEFWVPHGPILPGNNFDWAFTRTGDLVRIPVFAYKVNRALASIWALGLQVGMSSIINFRENTKESINSVILVLGNSCTDLLPNEDAFRCYIGIAVRTK